MKKWLFCLLMLPVCLWSGELQFGADSAFYSSDWEKNPEFQIWTGFSHSQPMLRGESALTENNNYTVQGKLSLSPVSLGSDLVWQLTPLAFLMLEQGTHLGTGWTFEDDIIGLGLNNDASADQSIESLNGIVFTTWLGVTIQFDLAAVLPDPGEFSHLVFQSSFSSCFQYYSGAERDEPWRYQADEGENFNGFLGKNRTVLGYVIPRFPIDFAGMILETKGYLGSAASLSRMDDNGWGSDFIDVRWGPLANWQISGGHSLSFLVQWRNSRAYTAGSEGEVFFMNRICTRQGPFSFERIALSYTYVW